MPTSSSAAAVSVGRVLAAARAVVLRARRGEAERAGGDRLAGEAAHLDDLVGASPSSRVGAALAHHVQPQRARAAPARPTSMSCGRALERVEVLGEALPVPPQALVQRGAGDVLDALHQLDQALVVARAHRREPDAAVAHHHGRDAVPRRRQQQIAPTWPARRSGCGCRRSPGVTIAPSASMRRAAGPVTRADVGDPAVVDGDVGGERCRAGAVDDGAAGDDEVMGHGWAPRWVRGGGRRTAGRTSCDEQGAGADRPRSRSASIDGPTMISRSMPSSASSARRSMQCCGGPTMPKLSTNSSVSCAACGEPAWVWWCMS